MVLMVRSEVCIVSSQVSRLEYSIDDVMGLSTGAVL